MSNACSSDSSDTSTLRSKDSGLSTMASMQADILSANEEAEARRCSLELRQRRRQSERPMTVAEFNQAQRRKAAMAKAAAMHAYVNLPPKLIGRAEEAADPPPPPLPQKDVGYASADNSPQHRSEFWFYTFMPPAFVKISILLFSHC